MKNKSKFILFGLFTGFCNGLFGSGGGMIAVPCLEKYAKLEPKKAHATAILIILPLTIVSLFSYHTYADVELKKLGFIVFGGVVGSFIGAKFLKKLSGKVLKRVFFGIYSHCGSKDGDFLIIIFASMLSGVISAMGIGGGVVLIPVLTSFFDIGQKTAQYINLLYFIPVALCALIVHAKNKCLCYKTALYVGIGGVFGALLGSTVAMNMSVGLLRRLFGIFLLVVGIYQFKTSYKT